ncbi:RHS repeat domain-containing protein [Corallococcus llansteffanensis]|uniref:Teneurin-like YD-shell domain-containing protein n=1 Tax=Corallococcus llansteffanensis TaxID=2316731 RepID=A0A3A8PJX4_9BACT|nr:RHS repeat-associated core domain-containing protein [Corallococcus llansteffanensis]RKH56653.1 hypothetical protein D7V93_19785 [Corallococcus llansteffanensis]
MLTAATLKNAVSPATGLVSFPLTLVELEGRQGLDFSLQALYRGGVDYSATTWNLEAPTGCLGLGWTLSGEMIFADHHQTGQTSAASYFYAADGMVDRLLPTGVTGTVTSFILTAQRFWKISYDSATETWTILRENGRIHTFGGATGPSTGARTSTGNSIEWGVRWGAWTGGSVLTQNQGAYALAWRLTRIADPWGNAITHAYTAFSDDSIPVGSGGLPYTRATYLDTVTDTFGRKVKFTYDAKLSTSSQQEYQAPHTGASPNPWQDRYETRYLKAVRVTDAAGNALMGVDFTFDVKGAGTLAKRYLTRVQRSNSRGAPLAPVDFTYRNGDGATPPGALDTVTLPGGATFAFNYAEQTLGQSPRTLSIQKTGQTTPRVWFDVDYAVVTWLDPRNPGWFKTYLYQWTGRWQEDAMGDATVADQYDNMRVVTEANLCGIFRPQYAVNGNKVKPSLSCYHKDPTTPGEWVSSNRRLDALALDEAVDVASGTGFLAALGKTSGKLYRITWNGSAWSNDDAIQLPTVSGGTTLYALCARNNWLAALYRSNSDSSELVYLKLWYLDASGTWNTGFDGSLQSTAVNAHDIMAYAGGSFLVLRVYNDKWIGDDYRYQAITWGADFSSPTATTLVDAGGEFTPGIHGGLVGIGPQLFRYNGVNWDDRINLKDSAWRYPGQTGDAFNMSYGFDKAVRRVTQSWTGTVDGYAYDVTEYQPAQRAFKVDSFNGAQLPSIQEQVWSITGNPNNTVRFPSNYVLLSNKLYYESPDASWSTLATIPDSVAKKAPQTVQLSAFLYLSYQSGSDAVVVPLRNGTALAPITLPGQNLYASSTSGKLLTGVNAFVTYTGTFDAPGSLTLYSLVKGQVSGTVKAWAVSRVDVNDGLGTTQVSYGYDTSKAISVTLGWAGLFNRTRVMPGSADGQATPYGFTDVYSFNGLGSTDSLVPFPNDAASTNAATNFAALVGLPYQESVCDAQGTQVAVTKRYWWVTTKSALTGGSSRYPRLRRLDSTVDGLTSTRTQGWSDTTGLMVTSSLVNTNWNGDAETLTTGYTYLCDAYPAAAALNLLTPVVQTTEQVITPQLTFNRSVTVSTWKRGAAGTWAPDKSYRARTNTSAFNFADWSGSNEPPATDWLKTATLSAPNTQGLQTELVDADGHVTSNLYDAANRWPVATFSHASLQGSEAGYFGCEGYEATAGWTVQPGGALYTGDSHTGLRCLKLAPVGQGAAAPGLKGDFAPTAPGRQFTVSFWAKTQGGYGNDSGEAWLSITLAATGTSTQVKVPDTQGAWAFVSAPAFTPCPSGFSGPGAVTLQFSTQKASTWVLIDDVLFLPADATGSVNAYDPAFGVVTATVTGQGLTQRTLFDDSQTPVAQLGPTDSPTELPAIWQVRDDPSGRLSVQQLNRVSRARSREAGGYEPFTDDWQSRWQATHPEAWSVSGRALRHAGSGADTCTWTRYGQQQNYGVRVQVLPPAGTAAPAGKVGLKIGNLEVSWQPASQPGTGSWYLGTTKFTNAFGNGTYPYASDWMFAVVDSRVLFWAGGRLLIDTTPQVSSPGVLVLEASTDVSFTGLVTFVEPLVDVVFKDGAGNDRQTQQMADGLNVAVTQVAYDGLLRPAVRTKAATFPMSGVGPLFAYQSAYLTNGGPGGTLWTTGLAEGQINTYWQGDGGYPFTREQYEASPQGRVLALGKPGKNFSLAGHPTRFAYGSSGGYRTTTLTDPNGVSTVTVVDRAGNPISRTAGPTQVGGTDLVTTRYSHTYSSSGQTNQVLLPVAGTTLTEQLDFLGRLVYRQGTDTGASRFIHDRLGRLRYALHAEGVNAGGPNVDRILYWTYDSLGRLTEAGTVDAAWSSLPALPDGGAPPPGTPVARKKNSYFGPGDANGGRLRQTATYAPGVTTADVTLGYTYTPGGNIASVTQTTTAGPVSHTGSMQYAYDNLGNTVRIVYPTATPLAVNYRYNRRGLVSMIGNDVSPAIYAAYTYNADTSILKESLGFLGSTNVNQTYTYNSPGWINTVSYNYFAGTLFYDTPQAGYQGAVYYDGTLQGTSARALYGGAPAGYTYRNAFDPLGQLRFAENTISTDWGIGIGKGVQYDMNGNLQALNRGNLNLTYTYGTGSDLLSKVDLYDAVSHQRSTLAFGYSPSGQVTSATPNLSTLTYDAFHRLASTLTVAAPAPATLTFRYGSASERVSKSHVIAGKTTTTVYVRGLEDDPLLHVITQPDGTVTQKAFVRGPNGLLAMVTGNKTCYVVRDHQGSTRVVFDQTGTVLAAFDYLPFGQGMRSSGDPTLMPYRYTGQEWDGFDAAGTVGLYNYQARLYDPIVGRFYDTDPAFQFASPYVYVGNNPFNFTDPTGMFWKEILGTLAVVGGAIATVALLPEAAALGGLMLIWGGYSAFSVIGGSYALARGGGPNEVADASLSFGIAGALAATGLVLGPLAGMSLKSLGMAEAFGVMNAFSMAPPDASAADMGYYLAAGLAVSFASEALGSVAAARLGGVGAVPALGRGSGSLGGLLETARQGGWWSTLTRSTAFENAVDASTQLRVVQKGVSGAFSGSANYGLRSAARGDSAGRVLGETLFGGAVYGLSSVLSGLLGGDMGAVGRGRLSLPSVVSNQTLNFGIQWVSEKAAKQLIVMSLDSRILNSRIDMARTVFG